MSNSVNNLKNRILSVCDTLIERAIGDLEEDIENDTINIESATEMIQTILNFKKFKDNKINNVDL